MSGPWLCGVCVVVATGCSSVAAPPELSATIWKREVAQYEPLLVRIELRHTSPEPLRLVPPYPSAGWPLDFSIQSADGRWLRSPRSAGSLPLQAQGLPWWVPRGPAIKPSYPGRRPWDLPPGAVAFMWLDLLRFYPLVQPGRYHIVFHYDPEARMLARGEGEPPPEGVWEGHLEADAGWITLREPEEADREAAVLLREYRDRYRLALSTVRDADALRRELLERFPGSPYVPYAAFYDLWSRARMMYMAGDTAELQAQAEQFAVDHAEFPLNYQLPVILRYGEWRQAAGRASVLADPPVPLPQPEAAQAAVREALERGRALRQAAAATGDYELAAMVEEEVGGFESRFGPLGQ